MVAETRIAETAVNIRRRMGGAPYLVVAAEARAAAFTQPPRSSLLLPIHAGASLGNRSDGLGTKIGRSAWVALCDSGHFKKSLRISSPRFGLLTVEKPSPNVRHS